MPLVAGLLFVVGAVVADAVAVVAAAVVVVGGVAVVFVHGIIILIAQDFVQLVVNSLFPFGLRLKFLRRFGVSFCNQYVVL